MSLSVIEAKKLFDVADNFQQMKALFDANGDKIVLVTCDQGWLGFMGPNKSHTQENVLKLFAVLLKASIGDYEILSLDMDKNQLTVKVPDNGRVSVLTYRTLGKSTHLSYLIDGFVHTSYALAKLDNPDKDIVTTGKNWTGEASIAGTFEPLTSAHSLGNESHWIICNPANHCSSIHDFLEAGLKLQSGDKYIFKGQVKTVITPERFNVKPGVNALRFILSAAALKGGCLIPKGELKKVSYTLDDLKLKYAVRGTKEYGIFLDTCESLDLRWPGGIKPRDKNSLADCISVNEKGELEYSSLSYYAQSRYAIFHTDSYDGAWSIFNNTLPTSDLTDEQYGKMRRAHEKGFTTLTITGNSSLFQNCDSPTWAANSIYRIVEPSSERAAFIKMASDIMLAADSSGLINETTLGALFDSLNDINS